MDLKAKVIQILPLQSGEGKNGPWKKQEFVVETDGQYPKKICFAVWGDKINEKLLQQGNYLNIFFDIDAREYNGKWYNDVKVWKMEPAGAEGAAPPAENFSQERPYEDVLPDDLPF